MIVVLGAFNYDLCAYGERFAEPGETLHYQSFETGVGGKGSNSACAAAVLGGQDVHFIGSVGKDKFAEEFMESMSKFGVKMHVLEHKDVSSGVAMINIVESGENSIVIVNGANNHFTNMHISDFPHWNSANMLICQCEIPWEYNAFALQHARERGISTILNLAPAVIPKDRYFLKDVQYLICNEIEKQMLDDAVARDEIEFPEGIIFIISLGEKGAMLLKNGIETHVDGLQVDVVDSTGAGDCLVGSFAHFKSEGLEDSQALAKACQVASYCVERRGTQKSYRSLRDLPPLQ
ncbi:hypothetical protein PCE1_002396 [Barthelona sp. PCE]